MRFIEEHIRKLLGRETPPSLNADDLWANISAGLDENLPPVGKTLPTNYGHQKWRVGVLLLLLLLGGGGIWVLYQSESIAQDPLSLALSKAPDGLKNKASFQSIAPTEEPAEKTTPPQKSRDETESLAEPPIHSASSISGKQSQRIMVQGSSPKPSAINPPSGTGPLKTEIADDPPLSPNETASSVIAEVKASFQPSIESIPAADLVKSIPQPEALPLINLSARSFKSASPPRFSIGLHVGGNLQIERFVGDDDGVSSSLNRASGEVAGQSLALDLRYRLSKRFALSLGAEYHRTVNTFRHTAERDTLVPHPTPPNTGLVNAILRHTVTHNNNRELFSLPLLFEYERSLGTFSFGLGAGLSANYQLSANGRSLDDNGRFVRYDAPTSNRFFLAYQLQPKLSWWPSTDSPWQLQLRADVRYFNLGLSSASGISQKGWLIGSTIGLRRTF